MAEQTVTLRAPRSRGGVNRPTNSAGGRVEPRGAAGWRPSPLTPPISSELRE